MTRRVSPRERDVLLQTLARSKATLLAQRITVVREMRALTMQLEQTRPAPGRHRPDRELANGDVTQRVSPSRSDGRAQVSAFFGHLRFVGQA